MHHANKRKVFLNPGDILFAEPGTHVHTLLGSCVAITLWHPYLHIGGMCHFVLPSRPNNDTNSSCKLDGRYGDEAMALFDLAIELHQTHFIDYEIKVFGGADISVNSMDQEQMTVGRKNTAKAIELLSARQADIKVAHVGESGSRRIIMDLDSGDVWVKHTNAEGDKLSSTSGIN